MWQRLFRGTSSAESGTLFQLRNLIFRRNILKDVTKHMNVVEDIFETVVTCYIVAAAMHFFAMKSSGDVPHANAFPHGIASKSVSERARSFQDKVLQVVDRYVLLSGLSALTQQHKDDNSSKQSATSRKRPMEHKDDPHLQRIAADHCYGSQRLEPPKKKRRLPEYIAKHSDIPHVSVDQQPQASDGVLNYSSAV